MDQFPHLPKREFKGSILMPGLVNAHTHLELTQLKGTIPPQPDFVSWVLSLISKKLAMSEQKICESVWFGVEESLHEGTTSIGEITNHPCGLEILRNRGLRGVLYVELIGKDMDDLEQWKSDLFRKIRTMQSVSGDRLRIGISPHTPYTLSAQRLRFLGEFLDEHRLPYTIHIAESMAEKEFFLHYKGDIKSRLYPAVGWQDMPDPASSGSSLNYLNQFKLVTDRLLAVHGVHLDLTDLNLLKEIGARVVLCPRSNKNLNVGSPPIHEMIERGLSIGLGTDSLASNTSLSLWDEMRFLMNDDDTSSLLSACTLIEMATLGGAKGLGLASISGSLEEGKEADLIAVKWKRSKRNDPAADLIEHTRKDAIQMVMVGGEVLMDRDRPENAF